MNSRFKSLFKNTGLLTISNFSSKLLSFFLVPLYTGVLTTAEYGQYDLVNTSIQMILPLITANIGDGVMRFSLDKKEDKRQVISVGAKFELLGIFIFLLLLYLNHLFLLFPVIDQYAFYVFLFYIASALNEYFGFVAKGLDKVTDLAVSGVLSTAVTIALNILFLIVYPIGLKGFYIANSIGPLSAAIYILIRENFFRVITAHIDKNIQKAMLLYSLPLIMNGLAWKINSASDRYVVTAMCGVAANGVYSISYKIPTIINTLQNIFTQAWQISVYKDYDKNDNKSYYKKTFAYINFLMCSACFFLIIFTRFIARILYSKDFFQAWQYVPFLLISSVINTSSGLIGPILLADKNTKPIATSAMVGALANIIMNIAFVYLIGVQGAAIATAISSYIIYVMRKRAMGTILDGKSYIKVMLSWVVLSIQACLMIYCKRPLSYVIQIVLGLILMLLYFTSIKRILIRIKR